MFSEMPEIDGVSICTWNSAHAPCSIMALEAGKHVLCEKPMATNVADAIKMKEAAEKNGKLLMIGFVRRFGKDCFIVNDLIKNDALGEIYYAKVANIRRNGNPGGWFGDKSRSGGGPLIDLGVHSIDLVRYLMGMPNVTSVYGTTYKKLGNRSDVKTPKAYVSSSATDHDICDCEDLASAMLRFDNGATVSVEMSFSLNTGDEVNNIQIFGTKAGVKMDADITLYGTTEGYLSDVSFSGANQLDFEGSFKREIDHFVDSAMGKKTCINTADDGIALMKILMAIYESAESGHEVVIAKD
jgi:predicted dehydrogenase